MLQWNLPGQQQQATKCFMSSLTDHIVSIKEPQEGIKSLLRNKPRPADTGTKDTASNAPEWVTRLLTHHNLTQNVTTNDFVDLK